MGLTADNERVQSTITKFSVDGAIHELHFYSRYFSDETELWLFGCGLGDQTLIYQLGGAFLDYVDYLGDPGLGKIMISLGHGASAFYPYRGDYNVAWAWGVKAEEIPTYLDKFQGVKPQLLLNAYRRMRKKAEELGYETLRFCSGVGHSFNPLGLKREGLGYTGLDNKGEKQKSIVLAPAMKRGNFEWINREPTQDSYLTVEGLNEWYNRKQIVLGMLSPDRLDMDFLPTRLFETLGSGTPFITYKLTGLEEHYGRDYPYQTTSREQTEQLIDEMLDDYEATLEVILDYSEYTHEHHSYFKRIQILINKLKEIN